MDVDGVILDQPATSADAIVVETDSPMDVEQTPMQQIDSDKPKKSSRKKKRVSSKDV